MNLLKMGCVAWIVMMVLSMICMMFIIATFAKVLTSGM